MITDNVDKYTLKDATHLLCCTQGLGRSFYDYYMPCIILKETSGGRLKILVFGERARWKEDKKKIRYVEWGKVIKNNKIWTSEKWEKEKGETKNAL